MAWWGQALLFVVFAAVLFLPGAVVLRALGARGVLLLGPAPAVSCAFYAVLAPAFAVAGIDWGLGTVSLAVGGLGAAVFAARRTVRRREVRPAGQDGHATRTSWLGPAGLDASVVHRRWLMTALLGATLVAVVPVAVGMGDPGAPLQQWDAVFHLNGVAFIRETGDASNVDGLYGAGRSVYYPTVWHSMVALVPGDLVTAPADAITSAANASTLVMSSVGWSAGIAAFAAACFPRRPDVTVLAVAVGGAFSMFPTVLLSTLAQWPNGLSVMVLPGTAALWVVLLRSSGARRRTLAAATLLAVVGVGSAHGSGVVGLGVVVGPLTVAVAARSVRGAWSGGHRRVVLVLGTLAVLGAGIVLPLALRSSVLQVLFNFERLPQRGYGPSVARTLLDVVLSWWPGNLVVTIAVVVGAAVLLRARDQRWLVVSTVSVVALVALAAGPATPLRALTGIWYTQAARIEALYPVTAVVLAAVGLAALGRTLSQAVAERVPTPPGVPRAVTGAAALVVLALVSSLGYQGPGRAERFAEAYDPAQIRWGTMLSADELELVRELRTLVGPDALVLGDPHNGAALAFVMGGRHVVLPQLGTSAMDEAQAYLRAHFRDIASDPEVCRYVEDLGVTHYYADTADAADGAKVDPESPGLQDVDTRQGFTVVAAAGTATLFTIDGC